MAHSIAGKWQSAIETLDILYGRKMVKWPPKHCVFHSRGKKESATKTLHMLYSRKGKCHQDIAHAIQQKRRLSPRHCTCHLQKKESATKTLHMLSTKKRKCHQDIAHAIHQGKKEEEGKVPSRCSVVYSKKKGKCH